MPTLWERAAAHLYDPLLALGELRGMKKRRARVLAAAEGRVLEIGAGTGLNLPHYPDAVRELVATEPVEPMAQALERHAQRYERPIEVVRAPAEELPFPDDSFDSAISTMVLCTVDDADRAIAELRRVLRPGGRLLAIEHLPSESPRWAAVQRRLERPWKAFACGCRVTRHTDDAIAAAGFDVERRSYEKWVGMVPIVRPLVVIEARARAAEV
jgi:ubiquinone/menaquinone biosynthesis C-methylase UbiE